MEVVNPLNNLDEAYQLCEILARRHYENFPVASWFLPKKLRRSIAAIYVFARCADDFADEGDYTVEDRLMFLRQFHKDLEHIEKQLPVTPPLFLALKHTIQHYQLPIALFFDLLSAFKQDVLKKTYSTFDEVLDYCKRSANPIGRLLLHLNQNASEANLIASDKICTALQLINFLQDIQSDSRLRQRCYLPEDKMQALGLKLQDIAEGKKVEALNSLVKKQLMEIDQLLNQGCTLCHNLQGLFRLEICMVLAGAKKVVRKLYTRKNAYQRPVLRFWDKPFILGYAFWLYGKSFCENRLL